MNMNIFRDHVSIDANVPGVSPGARIATNIGTVLLTPIRWLFRGRKICVSVPELYQGNPPIVRKPLEVRSDPVAKNSWVKTLLIIAGSITVVPVVLVAGSALIGATCKWIAHSSSPELQRIARAASRLVQKKELGYGNPLPSMRSSFTEHQ